MSEEIGGDEIRVKERRRYTELREELLELRPNLEDGREGNGRTKVGDGLMQLGHTDPESIISRHVS